MIRVLLATDVRLYREQLADSLTRDGRLAVAGTAAGAGEAIRRVGELGPEVVLLDVRMPGARRTARTIAEDYPQTSVLALGLSETAEDVLEWAEAGVGGWVGRDSGFEDLVTRVESAAAGEVLCPGRIVAALVRRLATRPPRRGAGGGEARLTPRELEVLRLLAEGLSNKEIGGRLHISVATVKNHVHNLLAKLGAHSRGEAASRARWTTLPAVRPGGRRRDRPGTVAW